MIELRVLGPIEISLDGHPAPPELLWRKHLALLTYLARSPRRTRTREHLMGLLWGEKPESSARHSLREAIRVLRHAAGESIVETRGDQLQLREGELECDVDHFEALEARGDLSGAASLALGEFMEGFSVPDAPPFEDWLAAERFAVRDREIAVLVRRAEQLERRGDLARSAESARRALALDPLSNEAARSLIATLALDGDRSAALATYEQLTVRMRDALGAEPDEPTRRLAERVRQERVWRERRPTPVEGAAASRRAPLVGRDDVLEQLLRLWSACITPPRDGGRRAHVAILEGPSGVGRTRLAEELASRARLDGAATVTVRGTPADVQEPWSGVWALARGGLDAVRGVSAAPAGALAAFASRIETWGDRFPGTRGAAALPAGPALVEVVRGAAAEQPVLLVLDDAHWLDAESLQVVHALARDAAAAPVFALCTALAQPPRDELEVLRSRLGREIPGLVVVLEPLGPTALRDLARWAMPTYTDVQVDRLARRIASDSAGLPLLAVELLHAVALGLDLHGAPAAWPEPARTLDQTLPAELPETITAAIRIGFRRLSHDAQAAVSAAAVLGNRVEPGRMARATGLDPHALEAALDEAEWQRWLMADARGYTFVARIARDVVARDMVTEGQRKRILKTT